MPTFEEQRAAITAATDALIAEVKAPSDLTNKGLDQIHYLQGEIRRIKEAFRAARVPLPLGKGGRAKKSVAPVTAVAAE